MKPMSFMNLFTANFDFMCMLLYNERSEQKVIKSSTRITSVNPYSWECTYLDYETTVKKDDNDDGVERKTNWWQWLDKGKILKMMIKLRHCYSYRLEWKWRISLSISLDANCRKQEIIIILQYVIWIVLLVKKYTRRWKTKLYRKET